MNYERIPSVESLGRYNRYDGLTKYFTGECLECESFVQFQEGDVCTAGVAWKFLNKDKILKTCSLKKLIASRAKKPTYRQMNLVYQAIRGDFMDGTVDRLLLLGFRVLLPEPKE